MSLSSQVDAGFLLGWHGGDETDNSKVCGMLSAIYFYFIQGKVDNSSKIETM